MAPDFKAPPPGYGDFAFILHIVASLAEAGRAGVVCPQGVLFRGQPEVDEETEEFDVDGNPKMKRRKADDEHLIRKALLDLRLMDAVISLPLNVFYGAAVPACLLILRRQRPPERRDKVLLVYAARHYRELSAQNELRPQDVMRILVHCQSYGDASRVPALVAEHSERIRKQVDLREEDEVGRLEAEYQPFTDRLAILDNELSASRKRERVAKTVSDRANAATLTAKVEKQREKVATKVAERDERVAEARRRADDDRKEIAAVGVALAAIYSDPDELLKHAHVVDLAEIEENEFNMNIPRYVDTFEPERRVEVKEALRALREADASVTRAEQDLSMLLREIGYAE